MRIQIFDVEHGACALITADNNARIMIDCGDNATTGWKPGTYLRSIGVTTLEKLVITNYDEDHVSGINDLFDKVQVQWIVRNTSISPTDIKNLKSDHGMGPGIERLVRELTTNFLPPGSPYASSPPTFLGVTERYWWLGPQDFDDENNLSVISLFNCGGTKIIFSGDMERAGWLKMLPRPGFVSTLAYTDILVASHHGRESGCCEEIFLHFKPTFVVISDKSMEHETQETANWYAARAVGGIFNGDRNRKVITTRSDGSLILDNVGNGKYLFRKADAV